MKIIFPIIGFFVIAISGYAAVQLVAAGNGLGSACGDAINVRSYGAKGDGVADDTAAIVAAVTASKSYIAAGTPTNSYVGSSDPICFPSGTYRITKEISMKAYANVYGDKDVTIKQDCVTCSSFVFHDGFTIVLRNLKFFGGKNQIYFDNKNVDGTIITIENSVFQSASDYAIYTDGTTDGHLSAEVSISGSQFNNNKKILRNVADHVVIRNSSMLVSKDAFNSDSAAIWNRGSSSISFSNVTATANMGSGSGRIAKARWIDNYGNFYADNSVFNGSDGGMPIVYQFTPAVTAYPWMGKSVSVLNSKIAAGPDTQPDSAVIVLQEAVPQLVVMAGNSYTATQRIFVDVLGSASFIDAVVGSMPAVLKAEAFHIQLEPGADVTAVNIPSALLPYITSLRP